MAKFLKKSKALASMATTVRRQLASHYTQSEKKNIPTNLSATHRLAHATCSWMGAGGKNNRMLNISVGRDGSFAQNEIAQRMAKKDESYEKLKEINKLRPQFNKDFRLPFKQKYQAEKKQLSQCASVQDILNYSSDPTELAKELLTQMRLLNKEQKKNEAVVKKYRQMEASIYKKFH